MKAETGIRKMNHMPPQKPGWLWNSTTRANPSEASMPGALIQRKTGSTERVIDSS